jgi:two-component system, chemotaxis family, protein-glutamate methylesterase/glutaminase
MTHRRGPVRVLVVDDSSVMRQLLTTLMSSDPEIEVVGTAEDPHIAREKIKALNPDVVTLDVEMPHMDGLTFLKKIMALRPMPVVMVSTLTQSGADTTLEALEVGAVDFIAKPTSGGLASGLEDLAAELQRKVKGAAGVRVGSRRVAAPAPRAPRESRAHRSTGKIVFVGASTGGVEALKTLLLGMPADCPPTLITQHMPPRFTASFAERLNRQCPMAVSEAIHDQTIEHGHVYIAPGSHHLEIARAGTHHVCRLSDGPTVSGHRPSVDVLFRSAARVCGKSAVAAILTGMGKDGAEGMLELRRSGAFTLGQDEDSSLIYGMPRAAFESGAVMRQHSLGHMADAILDACEGEGSHSTRPAHGHSHSPGYGSGVNAA